MSRSQFKKYCQKLTRKEKSYWNLKQSRKQELDNYEIDQFQSIWASGRTYPLKIPHRRIIILYRSIQNYSTIKDNTFLKDKGMLGPYNTSVSPYCYCCAHVVAILLVFCRIEVCYSYCGALTLLLLCRIWLYCDPLDSYIYKGGFFIWTIQELFIYQLWRSFPPRRG